jgi:ketosteroid isomerase-like protein
VTTSTEIGRSLVSAFEPQDFAAMRALLAGDVRWTMPGSASLSSTVWGAESVVDQIRAILASGVHTELVQTLVGVHGVALSLRNTGRRTDGRELDEQLAMVLTIRDGKVSAIDTYLSDVPEIKRYFD